MIISTGPYCFNPSMIQYSAPFTLAKETWKIIKNLSIADQPEKKKTIAIIAMILLSLLWTILSTLKPRKKLKLFLARISIHQGLQMQWLKRIFEIEPVCSSKMEYSSSNTLKNIVV